MYEDSNSHNRKHSDHMQAKPSHMVLARAYIPDQPFIGLLPLDVAFKRGSVFPNLDVTYPRI